jgi:hypothetical protein
MRLLSITAIHSVSNNNITRAASDSAYLSNSTYPSKLPVTMSLATTAPQSVLVINVGAPTTPVQDSTARSGSWGNLFGRGPKSSTPSTSTRLKTIEEVNNEANINKCLVDGLSRDLDTMEKELDATCLALKVTRQDRVALKFTNDALQTRITQLSSQIDILRGELSAKSADLIAVGANLEAQIKELQRQLSQAHVELENKIKQIVSHDENFKQLIAAKEGLEEELAFEQCTNQDLQNRLPKKDHQLDAEQRTIQELQNKLVDAKNKLDFKQDCVVTMKRKLRETEQEVEDLAKRLATQQADVKDSTETNAVSLEEVYALRQQLKECSEYIAQLQKDAEKQNRLLVKLKDTTMRAQGMLTQAHASRNELEQAKYASEERARILSYENEDLAHRISDVQLKQSTTTKDLEQKLVMSERERIAEREEVVHKTYTLLTTHRSQCNGYKDTILAQDSKIKVLGGILDSATRGASAAEEDFVAQIARLQDDMVRKNLDLEDERAKVAASWDWAQEKADENAELYKANKDLTDHASNLNQEQQALLQTNKDLVHEIAQQQKANHALEKRMSMLEGGQISLRQTNKILKQQVSNLASDNVRLETRDIENEDEKCFLKTVRDSLLADNIALTNRASDQDARIGHLLALLGPLTEQNIQQDTALEHQQAETGYLRTMIVNLTEQIEQQAETLEQQRDEQAKRAEEHAQELEAEDIWMQVAESEVFAPELVEENNYLSYPVIERRQSA